MFLTDDDIEFLTGYKKPADQRRWLTDHCWIFEIARTGRPRVLQDYAKNKMSGIENKRAPVLRTAHIRG